MRFSVNVLLVVSFPMNSKVRSLESSIPTGGGTASDFPAFS